MPYCTQNNLETMIPVAELAELTSELGDIPDSTVIAEIIDRVKAEIDSYVSMRYVTPFVAIPDIIKSLSVDMAIYHLYSRRSAIPLIRQTKYEDAIKFLQNVALGKSIILGPDGYETSKKSSSLIEINSSERIFSRSAWGNY
jgi:phage gp36-like protein